ncbi:MAG: hypothetical protein FJX72_13225, partial [Armatimonadetes bacterium]|nr:hypothetical protein [Armatimonadota bacterium]
MSERRDAEPGNAKQTPHSARGDVRGAQRDVRGAQGDVRVDRGDVRGRAQRLQLAAMLGLTLAAAALRVWGMSWGLPNADRMCSFHPDEGVNLVNGVLDRGALRPHLDIGFYNYGSLYFLLWQAAAAINSGYGLIALPPSMGPNVPLTDSLASITMVGRVLSVVMASGTVWLVCLLARETWGFRSGVVAGALQAVAPLATIHSRFATVDSTATFMVVATLWLSLRLLRRKAVALAAGAGLLAGLAGATRYNTVVVVVAALAAVALRTANDPRSGPTARVRLGLVVLGACLVGFLIGCPGALLNWTKFSSDLMFEARKSATGMGLLFAQTGNGWVFHWRSSLWHSAGWPLLVVGSAAALLALRRRRPEDIVILAFVAVYYGLMGAAQVRFMRYMLPVLPALFAWVPSVWPTEWPAGARQRALAAGWVTACGAAFAFALGTSVAFGRTMTGPDARDTALAHLRRTLPPATAIGFATTPWYWSPP